MFGKKLKELRKSKKLTQEQLAEKFNLTSTAIYKWEKGKSYPPLELVRELAKFFEVSTDYLLDVDFDKLLKLKIALKEAGLFNGEDDMTLDDFETAMEIALNLSKKKKKD